MHPTTSISDFLGHLKATVPEVAVVIHEAPVDADTGFIAVAREIDGHSAYLLPGTRYEEGDTITVSVVYDEDGPCTAYGRHGRGSWSREECSTDGVRDWARLATAATQYLNGACLVKVPLAGAMLAGAGLRRADMMFCDLRNADLRNADLRNADLRNADLRNADLRNADLTGALLHDAVVDGTTLDGAVLPEELRIDETVDEGGPFDD